MYYFCLLFYYNYRHGSIFDYYMADAVFKQAFNSAETARAYDNGIAFFLAALLNDFRRRAAAYNQPTDVLKRWQGEGTSNSMPRAVFGDPNQNTRVSDRFVENGSYLRLKNITLSYTFPKQWLQKAQIENARLSLSCENVATITGYSGFDPEVGINGIDQNRYPISRTFSLGLNFNF